ncbi:MAG: hypothetical protein PVJ14_03025 [Chromatiales bacterium]
MKRKRYSEELIISILKQHEAGRTVVDLRPGGHFRVATTRH